ncbi:MAG: hypothetical protein Q7R87_01530 [Nanoarchaeota archaeon]|nr:hypothetical protein [Nanoarchaeota archaeon]
MVNKDIIETRENNDFIIITIKQPNTEQDSYLFSDKIEYMHDRDKNYFDHHLMIYRNRKLIFKVWLPNGTKDKEFKDVKEALKSVGMDG